MSKRTNERATTILVQSIRNMIKSYVQKYSTKIYDGIILSQATSGKWNVQYNGENHALAQFSDRTISTGSRVKVFIPQGNQNLAFFM